MARRYPQEGDVLIPADRYRRPGFRVILLVEPLSLVNGSGHRFDAWRFWDLHDCFWDVLSVTELIRVWKII